MKVTKGLMQSHAIIDSVLCLERCRLIASRGHLWVKGYVEMIHILHHRGWAEVVSQRMTKNIGEEWDCQSR